MKVGIVGGSGYTGGELLRILLHHPKVEVTQVTSDSLVGKPMSRAHPNLRKVTDLTFTPHAELDETDFLFLATPHGRSMERMPEFLVRAAKVVDLSADFRLKDPRSYERYYGRKHPHPEMLAKAVYGLPELHREAIKDATLVSGAGCIATAGILALRPLARAGAIDPEKVVVDAKSGSSASGAEGGPASMHAERSGVMRLYAAEGHRHTAEVEQETGLKVGLSCHAVEAVRGVLATCHAFLNQPVSEKDIWRWYREAYGKEPFVRVVKDSSGAYRLPEPKILAGTNFCDVGFALDEHTQRVVAVAALDNLMKGAAGSAVQCMNLMSGYSEAMGLDFVGLHPI
ncbi:MAG TPA: N-acetyl-gamma-glutamyl-phosphate reductase [Thermoplasmata archaeon]|jgi:N-acetyl-gamma-glutamyl-phosphate/LysW-gamma-L-alpha-aminoadipyl-6-phosphate reductase|nr:N-acetyl-gamma-glutamyl-phosphate reductase [Thermoplasmata archaeon]